MLMLDCLGFKLIAIPLGDCLANGSVTACIRTIHVRTFLDEMGTANCQRDLWTLGAQI